MLDLFYAHSTYNYIMSFGFRQRRNVNIDAQGVVICYYCVDMLVNIDIVEKAFGDKVLYQGLRLNIEDGDKIGLVGRNGTGKSTLLNILSGQDEDYDGDIKIKKGIHIVASRQEHHGYEDKMVLDYIIGDLPEFSKLKRILDTYPDKMGTSETMMQKYSDALERFSQLGYFEVEGEIEEALLQYQVDPSKTRGILGELSGGQKRMAELVKVQRAKAHIALIDEPTNHMDYVAKASFISWMRTAKEAVMVITHDRDVLKYVNKIIEIRDGHTDVYEGNYDDYLRINTNSVTSEVNQYKVVQARIANLKDDVVRFRRLKEKARNPGTISRFKSLEQKAIKELTKLESTDKPSFWIDKDSIKSVSNKVADSYNELKTRNIRITTRAKQTKSSNLLVDAKNVQLSYGNDPLFGPVTFQLREGDRIELHGRNGAGKTTLVRQIIAASSGEKTESKYVNGKIVTDSSVVIGVYDQELDAKYIDMTLAQAIEQVYMDKDVAISDQKVKQLLGDYLFNPATDGEKPISQLSGGQKARFQLINMLTGDPNVLILDEPTNHLDLPSIEELDQALAQYHGAIVYISHDSYFSQGLGGKVINIAK